MLTTAARQAACDKLHFTLLWPRGSGVRRYIKCLYVYNKVDMITVEEMDALARMPNSTVASVYLQLNLDTVLEKMWEYMGTCTTRVRCYHQTCDACVSINGGIALQIAGAVAAASARLNLHFKLHRHNICWHFSTPQCHTTYATIRAATRHLL
jgi:ribosome-interacting GTPase 1